MKIFIKIVLNALLLISMLFICTGCVIFPYTSPDDFEHTKWTCDDPETYFYTNVNTSNSLGWLKIDGRIMLIEVHTVFNNKFTIESINDTDRK